MRGKLPKRLETLRVLRNIPAYAGKTDGLRGPRQDQKEHPRVCGENPVDQVSVFLDQGTSPRMRGKPCGLLCCLSHHRNIPAYAGKTGVLGSLGAVTGEHPRVCGENRKVFEGEDFYSGTSPRMRGKRVWLGHVRMPRRNIPAYAGKTSA